MERWSDGAMERWSDYQMLIFRYVGYSSSLQQSMSRSTLSFSHSAVVVVFRGTTDANPKDWLTNFDFVKCVPLQCAASSHSQDGAVSAASAGRDPRGLLEGVQPIREATGVGDTQHFAIRMN
jgi:hypothetical protein